MIDKIMDNEELLIKIKNIVVNARHKVEKVINNESLMRLIGISEKLL